jgi:hypothetical protein
MTAKEIAELLGVKLTQRYSSIMEREITTAHFDNYSEGHAFLEMVNKDCPSYQWLRLSDLGCVRDYITDEYSDDIQIILR